MDHLIGQTLGRYQILTGLGAGGMGAVYQGFDPRLNRYVAIKVGAVDGSDSAAFSERFAFEARSLAALSHPNITPIYDYGEQDGLVYLVMEYIDGGTLAQLTRSEAGRLSIEDALRWLLPVAHALDYAHANHIVHRDVKPANILLRGGQPVLTDFGISRLYQGEPAASADTIPVDTAGPAPEKQFTRTFGTPIYMSPEQCQGLAADHRTDIYSLGVVLFELIAAAPPFRGDSPWGVCIQHVSAARPRLAEMRGDLSGPALDRVQRLLDRALAKDPAQRYPDMAAMIAEMEAMLGAGRSDWQPERQDAGYTLPGLQPGSGFQPGPGSQPGPGWQPEPRPPAWVAPPTLGSAPDYDQPPRRNRLFLWAGSLLALCLLAVIAGALAFGPGLLRQTPAVFSTPAAGLPATDPPVAITEAPGSGASPAASQPPVSPPTAAPPTAPAGNLEAQVADFIRSYFGGISARNYETTWQMLSDNFKASGEGRDDYNAYARWWNGFERVDVLDVSVRVVDKKQRIANATVTLRYFRPDRAPQTETYTYRVIYNPDIGGWQIDL